MWCGRETTGDWCSETTGDVAMYFSGRSTLQAAGCTTLHCTLMHYCTPHYCTDGHYVAAQYTTMALPPLYCTDDGLMDTGSEAGTVQVCGHTALQHYTTLHVYTTLPLAGSQVESGTSATNYTILGNNRCSVVLCGLCGSEP